MNVPGRRLSPEGGMAGPWCTQVLADLGAEVLKVERPSSGDDTRSFGPPFVRRPDGTDTGDSAYFMAANRGKKSVTINIASAEGQQLVRSLGAACDVIIDNYKFGNMKRYGLDYESLVTVNSRPGNRDALMAIIARAMKGRSTADWMAALEPAGCRMSATRSNFRAAGSNTGRRRPCWANTRSRFLANCSASRRARSRH
jgi:crotonobetainyl-CoA:carnitine CoA-transferase CaiB-like acyl-CoA transferase